MPSRVDNANARGAGARDKDERETSTLGQQVGASWRRSQLPSLVLITHCVSLSEGGLWRPLVLCARSAPPAKPNDSWHSFANGPNVVVCFLLVAHSQVSLVVLWKVSYFVRERFKSRRTQQFDCVSLLFFGALPEARRRHDTCSRAERKLANLGRSAHASQKHDCFNSTRLEGEWE